MEIGKPQRILVVEPVEQPVPEKPAPNPSPEKAPPEPVEVPSR